MIIVTGAAGFIGSNLVAQLLELGYKDLILVDDFIREEKLNNFTNKQVKSLVDRNNFSNWIDQNHKFIQFVFHLGARTDTAEFNPDILSKLNTEYSKMIWQKCCKYGLPLIFASSAATYGMGEFGFNDDFNPEMLKPLNPYGVSKNEFDKWALKQKVKPYFWMGFKFFNVYGPNEYHKKRMASVVLHAYNQITETNKLKLFKSHNPDYKDGEQQRDFVYVKDVCDVMVYFMRKRNISGIFNLGTGKAETFNNLANATFAAMEHDENIEYIDTPTDIRDKYQYYTCANLSNLRKAGYDKEFTSLHDGVADYVKNYLMFKKIR